jgi:hypothetical protein
VLIPSVCKHAESNHGHVARFFGHVESQYSIAPMIDGINSGGFRKKMTDSHEMSFFGVRPVGVPRTNVFVGPTCVDYARLVAKMHHPAMDPWEILL